VDKTSVIIPSRNEKLLERTIDDIFAKAAGEVEVIAVLDDKTDYPLPERPGLTFIRRDRPLGIRPSINEAVSIATGKYLFKVDAHCAFAPRFDEALKNCDENWMVVPRLYTLIHETWSPKLDTAIDYYYLSCPWNHPKYFQMQSCFWATKTREKPEPFIDEIMAFQGSAWFMPVSFWHRYIHELDTSFGEYCEHQEISLKAWLGGGQVMVNKNTWYAHDHRTNRTRGYHRAISLFHKSHIAVARYFTENLWQHQIHKFDWLIEKFWPLPTKETENELFYWPENWRTYEPSRLQGLAYRNP